MDLQHQTALEDTKWTGSEELYLSYAMQSTFPHSAPVSSGAIISTVHLYHGLEFCHFILHQNDPHAPPTKGSGFNSISNGNALPFLGEMYVNTYEVQRNDNKKDKIDQLLYIFYLTGTL